jgi:predicted RNA binding protein YcfA (HicA-like mRNA interferase family)
LPQKYPPLKRREVLAILKALGFRCTHSRGSHDYWQRSAEDGGNTHTFTVTVDRYPDFSDRILVYMIEQSGVAREEFYGATPKTARKIGLRSR